MDVAGRVLDKTTEIVALVEEDVIEEPCQLLARSKIAMTVADHTGCGNWRLLQALWNESHWLKIEIKVRTSGIFE